jgi:hypothetical protein
MSPEVWKKIRFRGLKILFDSSLYTFFFDACFSKIGQIFVDLETLLSLVFQKLVKT